MASKIKLAILGCGDFLRWQAEDIQKSGNVEVAKLFDPRKAEAEKFAAMLGGKAVDTEDDIFTDPDIGIVALFVPPWVRKEQFLRAAKAAKHVLATKPFGSTDEECQAMVAAACQAGIKGGVIYNRTGDSFVETAKSVFDEGRFGRLALYKQDWIHAYPQWNRWATDPDKNGGPFMDAMIHNLNTANYLMGRPVVGKTFFSDNLAHPSLRCADTEAMVVKYQGGGVANLFITWAADLETRSTDGNDREHIDLFYMVTDQGWRITKEWQQDGCFLVASREGKKESVKVEPAPQTVYDAFAAHLAGAPYPRHLVTFEEAAHDIAMVRN
jgi:predicted dehydrogenase